MGYYLCIVANPNTATYVVEDLETGQKISLKKISHATFKNGQQKKAHITKILPADFKLSLFRKPNDRYLFKGENRRLLYDLSNSLEPFTEKSNLEKNSIVEFSDWE